MRVIYGASVFGGLMVLAAIAADLISAQPLNKLPPARAPCSVLSGLPCHPSFCDVFHRGPCFPQYLPPIGEDLRLTITEIKGNVFHCPSRRRCRVVADISMVTNPGTGHEERTDMNDTAKDAVAHEKQSFLYDLRTELNIAQIVRQKAAAKKAGNGVNYGALVRRSAISITRRSRDGARRLKLLTLD